MKTLIIASKNQHKIEELQTMLASLDFKIIGVNQFPDYDAPEETGSTFIENAQIKAKAIQKYLSLEKISHLGLSGQEIYILADDSGLECDDLKGAPGIYSSRYAGETATDLANNQKLVKDIQKVLHPTRRARFKCALSLIRPNGSEEAIEGNCEGLIVLTPKGEHGFGYDPLFYVEQYEKTIAELGPEIKNKISHRAKALEKLVKVLEK